MLSRCNSSSFTAYPCPSMKYLTHRHCGKLSSSPTISFYIEILPFIFCFRNSSIIKPDPMYIISPVCPLHSGSASKDSSTHHLMTLRLSALIISGRCRVHLMYIITLTSFPRSYSSGILTRVHRKTIAILMSFLSLDVPNSRCTIVWWNDVSRYIMR